MGEAPLKSGRRAFERKAWQEAYEQLAKADAESALACEDLERLAEAAYLLGQDSEAVAAWKRAHQTWVEAGEAARASRCGFWISFTLLLGGEPAQGAGWLARTQRLLEEQEVESVEPGYLLALSALLQMGKGDPDGAVETGKRVLEIAERYGDTDLSALALLSQGQALIQAQRPDEGVVRLDEAMVAVTAGDVSPILAGILYCAVILTCQRIFDLQRSQEWTGALEQWCATQPGLVAFRGPCLVHRSEILQLKGEWPGAIEEAERACKHLSERSQSSAGRAYYQRAELHRLRGEFEPAEKMYREAGRCGTEPQPGMSLLRLAQGDLEAAESAIRRVVKETSGGQGPGASSPRARVLGPFVEIMLATGDLEAAREAADELEEIVANSDAPFLRATSAQARSAVALAAGLAEDALAAGREAWTAWQQLEAPCEAARARVLIGRACEQLGDTDTARVHLDAARAVFERLGAVPDVVRLEQDDGHAPPPQSVTSLTGRELEVLALVAKGQTNKQIAAALHISEHTVARHLSNIFNKIGVSSRTAASAFAFEHGLV